MYRFLVIGFLFITASVWFLTSSDFGSVTEANATGGAFKLTKHGGNSAIDGGVWCPIAPCGVDRQISGTGPHYVGNAEAGKWQAGECMHCHEPHASFGGIEPPPSGDGPNTYLLFRDYGDAGNYAELCWGCHEQMSLGSPPVFGEEGFGYWGYYQGRTNFENSGHGTNGSFIYPGPQAGDGAAEPFPRRDRGGLPGANANSCLNCHSPHGVGAGGYANDIGTPATGNFVVASQAQIDAAVPNGVIPRKAIALEESLCLRCHNSVAVAPALDIKTQIDWYLSSDGSGHPVREAAYFGRHKLENESQNSLPSSGWFTPATAHAECTDCHNPHRVEAGTVFQQSGVASFNVNRYDTPDDSSSSPVKLGAVNQGVWGVGVIDTATGEVGGTIRNLTTNNRVYNLCFKCHSAWAWGGAIGTASTIIAPSTKAAKSFSNADTGAVSMMPQDGPDTATVTEFPLTDIASKFKTNNDAYHPLFASGKNRPELAGVRNPNYCNGASTTYTVPASDDCAPQVGVREDLVGYVQNGISYEQTFSQTFVPPWLHTSLVTCVDCHVNGNLSQPRGPHGTTNPFILRGVDTNISFNVCSGNSTNNADVTCATTSKTYGTLSGTIDESILCFNCHRADVYSTGTYAGTNYASMARQIHPLHGTNSSGVLNSHNPAANGGVRGVACLGCHGGGGTEGNAGSNDWCTTALCELGFFHGNSANTADDGNTSRLITQGSNWYSFTRSTVGGNVSCVRSAEVFGWNACTANTGGDGGGSNAANYNYIN